MKATLLNALCGAVEEPNRRKSRRFLSGLSIDELQYIAEFLGACILEASSLSGCTRLRLAEGVEQFEKARNSSSPKDGGYKMTLLFEFLCQTGLRSPFPSEEQPVRVRQRR